MAADMRLNNLTAALAAKGVVGVAVPDWTDKTTWQAWFATGAPVQASSDPNLSAIVQAFDTSPVIPTVIDNIDMTVFKILFNHENRIRILEGKATITVAQFKTAVIAL